MFHTHKSQKNLHKIPSYILQHVIEEIRLNNLRKENTKNTTTNEFYNIHKYFIIYTNILQYKQIFYNIHKYFTIYTNILQYTQIFYNIHKYFKIYTNIL